MMSSENPAVSLELFMPPTYTLRIYGLPGLSAIRLTCRDNQTFYILLNALSDISKSWQGGSTPI